MTHDLDFTNRLYYDYETYKEPSLSQRRFKHSDILPLISNLKNKDNFTVKKAGESVEHRSINLISYGKGSTKIFLWSQMHGDESTATRAIFDILNFLSANDGYNYIRNEIAEKSTLYFMPMVNPDGAERFQRRNLFEIDINRDLMQQQTPEARVLKKVFDDLKADFGFNLHDQSILYSAGHTFKSAAISFLAPPINPDKDIDIVRANAMKLIGSIFHILSEYMPGHVAKYKDDFEPRAFGDNFQKLGTSTILIESGGWKNDQEKEFIRKMNFIALLFSFKSITEKSFQTESLDTYENIPFNEEDLMDLIMRNLRFKNHEEYYNIDIGIVREEINNKNIKDFYYKSSIEDIGDLSVYFGYEDYDFSGMEIFPGKTYPGKFKSIFEIEKLNFLELYKNGYTNVLLDSDHFDEKYIKLPINIILNEKFKNDEAIAIENIPNLVIRKNNIVSYVIINGFLFDVINNEGEIYNGLIL